MDTKCSNCGAVIAAEALTRHCVCCALNLLFDPALATPDPEDRRIGSYQLLEKLGEGGMGVVWKAIRQPLNRIVALKLIRSGWLASEKELARFRTEFEVAASLDHPNIVPIYEVCDQDGLLYYTMRFIDGGSLADWLFARARPGKSEASVQTSRTEVTGQRAARHETDLVPRESARLVLTLARAVHYAHQHGIIHRDLKPSNILLDADRQPHIVDFGLAKRLSSDDELTASESVIGSVHYLAPEQAAGRAKHVTTATDVYSLGVILYEMIAGQLPFQGSNLLDTLRLIQESELISPKTHQPSLPADLVSICLKCLEKSPGQRYSSAEALAVDLECWLTHRPISASASSLKDRIVKWIQREPIKATALTAILTTAILTAILTSTIYLRRLPYMAMQHAVATANHEGVFFLRIRAFKEDRVTENFFRYGFEGPAGQWLRLEFVGIPADLVPSLRCQVKADQPGRPDPSRSLVLTNGQTFRLRVEEELDRNFYVASVGWSVANLLKITTNGYIRLTLLTNRIDYPGERVFP